ncbi:hypothetical protein MPNT_210036 [Candidatus Methylacidithermus pantelleriae]|uniref:Uncharacterized protein n=1 Tax=Candidatus Methylacidithermus pantelleriae TaxID=2744239 RepID=A0A8J2BT99_9BACT|nr:hypothetical protein MPNT_210036 [Candidatus Methylacidithermus pantelleriae]
MLSGAQPLLSLHRERGTRFSNGDEEIHVRIRSSDNIQKAVAGWPSHWL